MKPSTAQIPSFLARPDPAVRVILLYGQDAGLVRERADLLAKKTVPDLQDPFRVASISASAITDDPARLLDEMASQSLGGGRRLIRIQQAPDGLAKALDDLLKNLPPSDSLLLLEAGDLESRSKLRKLCETDQNAIALPCYVESVGDRIRTITEILGAEKLSVPREVAQQLATSLPPDRSAMRSELEKLALYAKGQKAVSLQDVQAVLQDAGAAELDDLVNAAALGDRKQVAMLLQRLFAEQTSCVLILRAAQRHFLRLQQARAFMSEGLNAGEAVKKLQPPVFWKYQDAMAKALQLWSAPTLHTALTQLLTAETAVKKTGTPDEALTGQVLETLARG